MAKNPSQIPVRDFLRNYTEIRQNGHIVIIMNRQEPEGVYIPYKQWEKEQKQNHKISIADLKPYMIEANKNLSKNIDSVYDDHR